MRRFIAIFGVMVCLWSGDAAAQLNIDECDGNPTACSIVSSTTSSTTTALVGGIVLTAVLGRNDPVALKFYLQKNAVAIRRDVNFGAGETLDDLALFFEVDTHAFSKWARKERRGILETVKNADALALIAMTRLAFRG